MALSGARFRRRKKEDVFASGYFVDSVTDVTPGADRTDETFHVYGNDSAETDIVNNFGTMSMTMLDKYSSNGLLDIVNGYDPASTGARQYNVNTIIGVSVFANVKNKLNTQYIKSYIVEDWLPGLPVPTGDANAKASWQLTGNGKLPRTFEGAWIKTKKLASGAAVSLGDTPLPVPQESGIYAVQVQGLKISGSTLEQESVAVSNLMVDSAGAVDFGAIEGALSDLDAPLTHALVFYLQSGTGVHPSVVFQNPWS